MLSPGPDTCWISKVASLGCVAMMGLVHCFHATSIRSVVWDQSISPLDTSIVYWITSLAAPRYLYDMPLLNLHGGVPELETHRPAQWGYPASEPVADSGSQLLLHKHSS